MKPVSHKDLHTEWMQDAEYSTAWKEEERKEKLRGFLAEWRKQENLTKVQVAERMGVTPPVISRLENNITRASIDTLTRYAHACGIKKPVIALY
ncbi:helix-turn-helix transcriptional regulator [Salmonella enterica subsp. enterica serovar Javiana]|nr:helix-turn-helix transcriptional regulator [Salmonella enterica subsp. enterica serovar Javiana]EAV6547700.1 helix-turn-helix transcriptional regulator [Salmonella enterica]EDL0767102.1 XRE family transcriptional regulator [Salmonella enterica subsp. enterica serovar Muenchen]EEJ1462773.1 helix-turn-helix transcriptional regulator [Salmonella enterica subsp. enterica serovar Virginia]EBD0388125.1 helix-turn-helix transcriptional regulator [Salmonella enterica]